MIRTEQARDEDGFSRWQHACGWALATTLATPGPDCGYCLKPGPWRPLLVVTDAPQQDGPPGSCGKCGLTVGEIVDRGAGQFADGRMRFMHAHGNCPTADELPGYGLLVGAAVPQQDGPVVLSLPQVPEGAVALVGKTTRVRYDREVTSPVTWRIRGDRDALTLLEVFQDSGPELEVVMAPPREPRTWEPLEGPPPGMRKVKDVKTGEVFEQSPNGFWGDDQLGWLELRYDRELIEVFDDEAGTR